MFGELNFPIKKRISSSIDFKFKLHQQELFCLFDQIIKQNQKGILDNLDILLKIDGLKELIPQARKDFAFKFQPKQAKKGDLLINYQQNKPPFIILVTGSVKQFFFHDLEEINKLIELKEQMKSKEISQEEYQQLRKENNIKEKDYFYIEKSGSILGEQYLISDTKYKRCYIIAGEQTCYLEIGNQDFWDLVQKIQQYPEYIEKLEFIQQSLPEIEKLSRIMKDKICRSFKEIQFQQDHILFQEGDQIKLAYLIKQGEVELFSNKDPIQLNFKEIYLQSNQLSSKSKSTNKNQQKYDQNYTKKQCILQKKGKYQWIGEEGVLSQNKNSKIQIPKEVNYTAICKSNCTLYLITKSDFQQKIPKEIQNQLIQTTIQRDTFFKN